jgi:hypothetical protein
MRIPISISSVLLLFASCTGHTQQQDSIPFKSEKFSRTATITLNWTIDKVFPLFGAFEERKWSPKWNPSLIYPETEIIEEGTTFKTAGHGHGEGEFIWRVSRFDKINHSIQYLVSSENRWWTITIQCNSSTDQKTQAEITYTFIGLNELGNEINRHFIDAIYRDNLENWQVAINEYLAELSGKGAKMR